MVGAALGYFSPVLPGSVAPPGAAGLTLGVSAGYRWRFLYVGAAYQYVILGSATYTANGGSEPAAEQTLGGDSDYGGLDLVALTSPDADIAAFFRVGAGYRIIRWSQGPLDRMQASNVDLTLLGIGVQLKAGAWLRIVPQASLEVGPLNAYTSLSVTTYFDLASLTR